MTNYGESPMVPGRKQKNPPGTNKWFLASSPDKSQHTKINHIYIYTSMVQLDPKKRTIYNSSKKLNT